MNDIEVHRMHDYDVFAFRHRMRAHIEIVREGVPEGTGHHLFEDSPLGFAQMGEGQRKHYFDGLRGMYVDWSDGDPRQPRGQHYGSTGMTITGVRFDHATNSGQSLARLSLIETVPLMVVRHVKNNLWAVAIGAIAGGLVSLVLSLGPAAIG